MLVVGVRFNLYQRVKSSEVTVLFVFLFVLLKSLCISQEAVFIFVFCFVFHCWENVSHLLCCSILVLAKGACIGKHLFWIPVMKANFFALTFFFSSVCGALNLIFVLCLLSFDMVWDKFVAISCTCIFDFNICVCRTWLYAVGCTCFSLCISVHGCLLLGAPVSQSLYLCTWLYAVGHTCFSLCIPVHVVYCWVYLFHSLCTSVHDCMLLGAPVS